MERLACVVPFFLPPPHDMLHGSFSLSILTHAASFTLIHRIFYGFLSTRIARQRAAKQKMPTSKSGKHVSKKGASSAIDTSDSDDDEILSPRGGHILSHKFPSYQCRSYLPPVPNAAISPDPSKQLRKEAMKLLSGRYAWDEYLRGERGAGIHFSDSIMAFAVVRKQESMWQASVTRRAALSIEEATQPKSAEKTYAATLARKRVMDEARGVAHNLRLAAAAARHSSRSAMRDGSVTPQSSTASRISSVQPSLAHPSAEQEREHLLLLNDEMLVSEATVLKRHSPWPLAADIADEVLRHQSLSPALLHASPAEDGTVQRHHSHRTRSTSKRPTRLAPI